MAENKIEIIIAARDLASGVIRATSDATRAYHQTLHGLNGVASDVSATIRNLVMSFGGFSAIQKAASAGYQFNQTIEDTRVGIASLVYAMNEFRDASGTLITGQQAFDAALRISEDVQNRLRIAGLATAATYEQLIKAYSQAYVPALEAGFDEKKVIDFTVAVTQAATAMRIPLDMLGEEVRSILSGTMQTRNTFLQPLMNAAGLTNEKIRALNKEGKLFDAVMKALQGSTIGAAAASKNFSVMLSNLKDAMSQALGKALETGFQTTKKYIKELTDSIVTFDEKTGEIKWNENLIAKLRAIDETIFSVVRGIRDMSAAISDFTTAHPVITDLAANIGTMAIKAYAVILALRAVGGIFVWLRAHAAANLAFIATLFGGTFAAMSALTVEAIAVGGALGVAGLVAGMFAAAMAGWKIGKYISEMQILGLTIGEAMQAGYASVAKFFAYCVYTWDVIGITAKTIWNGVSTSLKIIHYSFLASLQEMFPRLAKFFGVTDDYRKKIEDLGATLKTQRDQYNQGMTAALTKRNKELSLQEDIRNSVFKEADIRRGIVQATDKATQNTDKTTNNTKKAAAAAVEYSLAHRDVDGYLDRANDILTQIGLKTKDFALEIKKITATDREIKLLDIEKAYEHDMAAINKYKTDIDRQVRELQEKIQKAQEEAAEKNKKAAKGDPLKTIDPQVFKDLEAMKAKQKEVYTEIPKLTAQAGEKRSASEKQTNTEADVRLRALVAAQKEEYAKLTGTISDQYAARAASLRARLDEELADTKKTDAEKAAIEKVYLEQINQAREAAKGSWSGGAKQGFREYANMAMDTYKNVQSAVVTSFNNMTDALTDFVMTGKLNFRDFADSVIEDLIRIAVQKNITGSLAEMAGEINWGAVGTSIAGFFGYHQGGMGTEPTFYRFVPNISFAGAPRFHSGFAADEYPAILQKGEGVFTAGQMKALGLLASGKNSTLQEVRVNIVNQSGQEMKVSNSKATFDAQELIVTLWMDAASRNAFGLRTMLGG